MTERLSVSTIFEHLGSMGLSKGGVSRNETGGGWRIRAEGGLVVQISSDGRFSLSGRNARLLRKALGLTGRRKACA